MLPSDEVAAAVPVPEVVPPADSTVRLIDDSTAPVTVSTPDEVSAVAMPWSPATPMTIASTESLFIACSPSFPPALCRVPWSFGPHPRDVKDCRNTLRVRYLPRGLQVRRRRGLLRQRGVDLDHRRPQRGVLGQHAHDQVIELGRQIAADRRRAHRPLLAVRGH